MFKRSTTAAFLLLMTILPLLSAEAYTVVMKNGRTMKGTLISETADVIVLKDDTGVQLSLKKSFLDLAKMEEANKPAPAPVPAPALQTRPEPVTPPPQTRPGSPKKPARVYTDDDILRLKGFDTTGLLEPGVDDTGDPYINAMHSAAAIINDVLDRYQSLAAMAVSAYDISVSTGGDGNAAMQKFFKGDMAAMFLKAFDADAAKLNTLKGRVAGVEDQGGAGGESLAQAVTVTENMRSMLITPHILASSADFEAQVNDLSSQLANLGATMGSMLPAGVQPEETPPEEPPSDDSQEN